MNLGVIGAIGGAASGFEAYISEEQKLKRQEKMENLRTTNRRESDRLQEEMRQGNRKEMEDIRAGNNISLENLRSENRIAEQTSNNEQIDARPTTQQKNLQTLIEQGVAPADAVKKIWPDAGRSGSSAADISRDFQKRLAQLQDPNSYGMTLEEAVAQTVNEFNASGLQPPQQQPAGPQFSSLEEALTQARSRYPDVPEATLVQRITERFPELSQQGQ